MRTGLAKSVKGIDGGKKIKGIKRHLAVDSNGFPLTIVISRANVHDSKGAIGLAIDTVCKYPTIRLLKADNGYRGPLVKNLKEGLLVELECVKSNFGTSEFKPISGRWVVERTLSWLESFRRLNRNYEQFLHTAKAIAMAACAMFMLRFVQFSFIPSSSQSYLFSAVRGRNYLRLGQSSCICVRLFRSQCNRIAPSLREHICTTLDRPSVNKYWGTGSKSRYKIFSISPDASYLP